MSEEDRVAFGDPLFSIERRQRTPADPKDRMESPDIRTAPMAMDEEGKVRVICEACGSTNLNFDGWDIDKCFDCGHWRYRVKDEQP